MFEFNSLNNNLHNLFSFFNNNILNINNKDNFDYINNVIQYILLFCINNIYLLNKLLINVNILIHNSIANKKKYIDKLKKIENSINNINTNIIDSYNKISIKKTDDIIITLKFNNIIYNSNNTNNTNYNSNDDNNTNLDTNNYSTNNYSTNNYSTNNYSTNNLDLYSLSNIDNLINNNNNNYNFLKVYKKDDNFIDYKYINIGFGNYYKLCCYKYLKSSLPFNLLMHIQELDQIVIKVGDESNYKYINSKLFKVYTTKNEQIINNKSILCNNNIKELNKKCYIDNCKYYHDYIIGYKDNYHKDRQFSSNPIVYNCSNFKDGTKVKENIKNIEWYEAINLYQSSLSNLLIGCVHSLQKK